MRRWWSWIVAVLCVAPWGLPAQAVGETLIVGRADADASGGWPVVLWVLNGDSSHVVVRAPRAQLATLPDRPWERLDAEPLMDLERYGAPRLAGGWTYDPCRLTLLWERVINVASDGGFSERMALTQPACGATSCGQDAWRMALPQGTGSVLPLRQLLPWLASNREEWLVVYVISPDERLTLANLPRLKVPERPGSSFATVPAEVAAQFPVLQTAMLTHAAASQGLAEASALMRVDALSTVTYLRFSRNWDGTPAHRQALGVADPAVQGHRIVRLLLRLKPADRPATLTLQPVERGAEQTFVDWHTYAVQPGSVESCRRRIEAMDCEAACTTRIAELRQSWASRYGPHGSASSTSSADLMAACVPACRQQMSALSESVTRDFEETAKGQEHLWRQLESLTGLPSSHWRPH